MDAGVQVNSQQIKAGNASLLLAFRAIPGWRWRPLHLLSARLPTATP